MVEKVYKVGLLRLPLIHVKIDFSNWCNKSNEHPKQRDRSGGQRPVNRIL